MTKVDYLTPEGGETLVIVDGQWLGGTEKARQAVALAYEAYKTSVLEAYCPDSELYVLEAMQADGLVVITQHAGPLLFDDPNEDVVY